MNANRQKDNVGISDSLHSKARFMFPTPRSAASTKATNAKFCGLTSFFSDCSPFRQIIKFARV